MDNPYQPPLSEVAEVAPAETGARRTRLAHIQHEASIRSFGLLFLFGGGAGVLGGGIGAVAALGAGAPVGGLEAVILGVLLLVGVVQFAVGLAMRRLDPRARIPGSVVAGISALSFPIGTMIGGYVLYLLNSEKGRVVLSPAYAEVRAQTPDMRPRTSVVAWAFLGLLVLGLVVLFAGVMV